MDDQIEPPPRAINIFGQVWRDWLFRLYRFVLSNVNKDFFFEVAKGNIAGHTLKFIQSRNPAVGTSFEDVWDGGVFSSLDYDAQTGNFTPGLVLTGGTSTATAIIVTDKDDGTTGTLVIRKIAGTFQNNETITDTSTGSATSNGTISSLGIMAYPTTGETWEIICESANDTSAGTAARTVDITYLDDSYIEQTETKSLNGQTAVTFTATDAFRFVKAVVKTWGSATDTVFGKTNLGSIVIRDSTSEDIRGAILFDDSIVGDEHGNNESLSSHVTIEANKSGFIKDLVGNTSKNNEADFILLGREFGSDAFKPLGQRGIYQNTSSANDEFPEITEKMDIKIIARSNNNAVPVNNMMGLVVVDQ